MKIEKHETIKLSAQEMELYENIQILFNDMLQEVESKEIRYTVAQAIHALNCAKYFIRKEEK